MYFTNLRNSLDRYISEYLHMKRKSAFWDGVSLRCNGKSPPYQDVICAFVNDTSPITFFRYANCPHSLSNNRQTRMLASLAKLGCYSHLNSWSQPIPVNASLSSHQADLLLSAIDNLAVEIATFGLIEHTVYTQYIYRMVLGLIFKASFVNKSNETWTTEAYITPGLLPPSWKPIAEARNRLDKAFISFARLLFSRRLAARLRAESSLTFRWRLRLHDMDPSLLINDVHLEKIISNLLTQFLRKEAKRRLKFENTHPSNSSSSFSSFTPVPKL